MPSLEASVQLFLAGFASWTVGIFSGGGGSLVLLAVVTHVIRVRMVAPVITIASLMASPTRILVSLAANRMESRAVVSARRRRRRGGWQLDLEFCRHVLAETDRRPFSGLYTLAISAGQSRAFLSHASSFVHSRIVHGGPRFRHHRRQQYGLRAVLFELWTDKRTNDCNRRVPFAFYSANKDRHLWVIWSPDLRINVRGA